MDDRIKRRIKEMDKIKRDGTSTEFDRGYTQAKKEVYQEDCEDFMRESKTYRAILDHRRICKKLGKEFCLDCFGGGLNKTIVRFEREKHSH